MTSGVRLFHKGLIFVSAPLLFALLFLLVLSSELRSLDLEIDRQIQARTITEKVEVLSKLFLQADVCLSGYSSTRSPVLLDRFQEILAKIPRALEELKRALSSEEKHKALLENVAATAAEGLHILRAQEKLLDDEATASTQGLRAAQLHNSIKFIADTLDARLRAATKDERKVQEEGPELRARRRQQFEIMIGAAAALSVATSAVMSAFFAGGISRRIQVVVDNSERLVQEEELLPEVNGSDEIADLDSSFRKMAAAVREARQRERAAVENALDVICSLDRNGRFLAANPAVEQVFGYRPDELIGEFSYADMVVPEDFSSAQSAVNEIIRKSAQGQFETRVLRKNGQVVHCLWSCRWSASESSLFCVIHDVTERKEAEQLRQEVVAMITHDLKTPLTTVNLVLEMLEQGNTEMIFAKEGRLLRSARTGTKVMSSLISDLLDIEKIKSGKMELNIETVSLQEVLRQSGQAVSALAQEYEIRLELVDTQSTVRADKGRLIRVLVNLLSNAVKFSPKGACVSVAVTETSSSVEIMVQDRGRGIPESMLDKIFERFEQTASDDARKHGGSGLGLPICKAIVELHGGNIRVESKPGSGSVFTVRLPRS